MYNAKPFRGKLASRTKEEWEKQIEAFERDEDVLLASMYEARLAFASKHKDTGPYGFHYGIVAEGKDYAQAVIEVTHKRVREPQLKLLQITLEPHLDLDNRDGAVIAAPEEGLQLLVSSITAALRLTFTDHPSLVLKIYARTDYMRAFLAQVAEVLSRDETPIPEGLYIEWEGRWLLFKMNNR
ncbi:hypothetical protein [Rubrivirga sp.]|uniref:hypothetical protein n=1 Tax=Rubrivirga sp. TaxID=1885344 RepID=UPI003B51D8E8